MGCKCSKEVIEPLPALPPEKATSETRSTLESDNKEALRRGSSAKIPEDKEAAPNAALPGFAPPPPVPSSPEPEEPEELAVELKREEDTPPESNEQLAIVPKEEIVPAKGTKKLAVPLESKMSKSVSSASFESAISSDEEEEEEAAEGSSGSDENRLRGISTDKLVKELSKRMVGEEEAARNAPNPIAQVQRLRTFYGFRKRVNTYTDLSHHPNDLWWSEAHNDCPKIVNDMGKSPQLLSEVIKVRVVRRPKEELESDMSYFSDYVSMGMANPERRYFVFKLGLGDHIVVTLSEVLDDEEYDKLFTHYTPEQMLMDHMKFITCPANLVVPVPLLGPKSAQTLGVYFGKENVSCQYCSTALPDGDALRFVSVYIDLYIGRISDFFLVDYEKKLIYSSFRLVCTEEGVALMNK
ncbi:hypothetical protein FOL47_008639 [Perkinsus chesapeaki]|uniref:Uncharacterized protein n=1 Tax=Perkinsus chesapeaki TaxID=330153 RepID=A0A7J6LCT8_PERCH|nr:hypothetical protein FOL47_008639 [Perkinsus chesapeaki]